MQPGVPGVTEMTFLASLCPCHRRATLKAKLDGDVVPTLETAMLIAIFRTFLVFFLGGLLIATVVITVVLIGRTVWLDSFHDNATLTCGDALLFVVVSPVYGIGIAMALYFLPLIVGTALAVLGRPILGCVPLWYVMAILPVCVLAYSTQTMSWFPLNTELRPLWERLLIFSGIQFPALLVCWWWDRRTTWT